MFDNGLLRKMREEAGVTQADVTDHLGISENYYWHIETGRRPLHALTPERVEDLSVLFDLDEDDARLFEACLESFSRSSPWGHECVKMVLGWEGEG